MSIKDDIIELAKQMGIDKIGFTTRERLSDAPPSADLGYVLPEARSAVSLAVALEKAPIRAYLSKKDQMAHVEDHKQSYITLGEAGMAIVELLKQKGYEAVSPIPNIEYRQNQPYMAMLPPISHRYVAVASGIGWLGWSGNVHRARVWGGHIPHLRGHDRGVGAGSHGGRGLLQELPPVRRVVSQPIYFRERDGGSHHWRPYPDPQQEGQ